MRSVIQSQPARISEWKVVKGGFIVAVCILGGQALGFIRQATIAYLLGTGPQADAIAVAFAPVDLWWAVFATTVIFGYGPLMAAGQGSPSFTGLVRPVMRVAVLATAAFLLFPGAIVRVLAPGLPAVTAAVAEDLLRVTALAIPAISLSTLFTALLYSERRFAFAAFHQGMVNLSTIAAALLLHSRLGPAGFAIGYAAGAWLQLAAAYAVSRPVLRLRPHGSVETQLRAPASVLFYSLLIGMNPVVTRAVASTFGPGATAAFDYCLKLVGVPLALLVNPLSSSLLSEIAPFRLRRDRRIALWAIARGAVVTGLASAALVAVMLAWAPWIVALLFERGQFSAGSTLTVSSMMYGFYPVLITWTVLDVISRSLFSLGRPRVPIVAALLTLALNSVLSVAGGIASLKSVGVPAVIGFSAGAVVAVAYLWRIAPGSQQR